MNGTIRISTLKITQRDVVKAMQPGGDTTDRYDIDHIRGELIGTYNFKDTDIRSLDKQLRRHSLSEENLVRLYISFVEKMNSGKPVDNPAAYFNGMLQHVIRERGAA